MKKIVWLDAAEVRAIHLELIAEYGGLPRVRDENLLESALARPRNLHAYGSPTLSELAAAYGFGLAKNHPFVDGNKRVALAAMGVFLDVNGCELVADQGDAVRTILQLAAGELGQEALAAWVAKNCQRRSRGLLR